MLNAFRLKRPIPIHSFIARTGLPLDALKEPLQEAAQKNFLQWNKEQIKLTPLGWQFMNDALQIFC